MSNTYTVTATDGITQVAKTVAAESHIQAAATATNDEAAYSDFDDTATLTITVTQP